MFDTIFNTIGSIMTTIICYIIPILPLGTPEEKEIMKQQVKNQSWFVGMVSLIAMLVAIYVLPMLGLNKLFKKRATRRRKRKTYRRRK